jgi:hypothetical protein
MLNLPGRTAFDKIFFHRMTVVSVPAGVESLWRTSRRWKVNIKLMLKKQELESLCLTTDWTIGVRFTAEAKDFSSSGCVQTIQRPIQWMDK